MNWLGIARPYLVCLIFGSCLCGILWTVWNFQTQTRVAQSRAVERLQRLADPLLNSTEQVRGDLARMVAGDGSTGVSRSPPALDELVGAAERWGLGIGWFSDDGSELYSTAKDRLANASLRAEFREALRSGQGASATTHASGGRSLTLVARRIEWPPSNEGAANRGGGAGSGSGAGDAAAEISSEPPGAVVAMVWARGWVENERAAFPPGHVGWLFAALVGLGMALLIASARRFQLQGRPFADAALRIAGGDFARGVEVEARRGAWREVSRAFDEMQSQLQSQQKSQAEDRLRIEAVLASMIEGVLAVDHDLRVTLANQAAVEMLSLPADVQGRYVDEVVRIPRFEEAIRRSRSEMHSVRVEFETVGIRRRTLSMRVTPMGNDPAGELAIVLHDVSELRRLETMRRDFVANVSHELKTPLASIKAFAETLRLGAIDDQAVNRQFLGQIEQHADLLDRQIRDLLHLAQVESGRTVFELVPVDLNQIAGQTAQRFASEAAQRGVRLIGNPTSQPVLALADREAVGIVLDNLISNAIRYTRAGGEVRITVERTETDACVSVADTGIGIAQEHHERIFERFYRVDKARSRDVGGTGLGLAIVKHTVQALGGRIHLTSRVGKGSTFRVRLPGAPADDRGVGSRGWQTGEGEPGGSSLGDHC
jgi:two-component system phosphate regulon sensor histidine kinase PhoR